MRHKASLTTILTACLAVFLLILSGCMKNDQRPVISDAERALAMWQVQNVMSKHAYYHAAGMHLEELEEIWVDENGPNAKTAKFSSPNWIMAGLSTIKNAYGQANQDNKVKELEEINKIFPEIQNIPENLGAGHEWAMHTNTTPIIEVAGDGKTAKGIWYSPGMGLSSRIQDTSISVGSTFFWEKYGADFIKEDGEWKLWHCQMYYDFTPSLPASMTANLGTGEQVAPGGDAIEAGERMSAPGDGQGAPPGGGQGAPPSDGQGAPPADGQGAPPAGGQGAPPGDQGGDAMEAGTKMTGESAEGMLDNPEKYPTYSPTRIPTITPRFPEPYYTFSETFSY